MVTTAKKKPTPARSARGGATHVVGSGRNARSRMVDVSDKPVTTRTAVARARITFPAGNAARILRDGGPKGPITEVARTAGVLAAKRTSDLIPLCHPLGLESVDVEFVLRGARALEVRCTAVCAGKTGVEMEALVGAALAALTVYDMTKAVDHGITIERIELVEKRGGRSGHWKTKRKA